MVSRRAPARPASLPARRTPLLVAHGSASSRAGLRSPRQAHPLTRLRRCPAQPQRAHRACERAAARAQEKAHCSQHSGLGTHLLEPHGGAVCVQQVRATRRRAGQRLGEERLRAGGVAVRRQAVAAQAQLSTERARSASQSICRRAARAAPVAFAGSARARTSSACSTARVPSPPATWRSRRHASCAGVAKYLMSRPDGSSAALGPDPQLPRQPERSTRTPGGASSRAASKMFKEPW